MFQILNGYPDKLIPDYDILIIGPGPAGIAAAITCKQKGLSTLIIADTKNNTHDHIESVHSGIFALLERIDCANCLSSTILGEFEGIESNATLFSLGQDESGLLKGYHINRTLFDLELERQAIKYKIDFLYKEKVIALSDHEGCVTGVITESRKKIVAKYVIDASGHKKFAGRKLKFKEEFFSKPLYSSTGIFYGIEPGSTFLDKKMSRFIPDQDGWLWLAPIKDDECYWTELSSKGRQSFLPPDQIKKYRSHKFLRKANRRWSIFRPLYKTGLLLCGDAAGILDPAAGQGVLNALYSGIRAAETALECIDNPAIEYLALDKYDSWFYNQYTSRAKLLSNYYCIHKIDVG